MLQKTINPQPPSFNESEPPASAGLREAVDYGIGFLRRQYLIVVVCLLLSLVGGGLYLFATPPSFTASTTMMIDTRKAQFLQQSVLSDIPIDSAWMETQIGILKSENTALAVVRQMKLTDDPKFVQSKSPLVNFLPASISSLLGLGNTSRTFSEGELANQVLSGIEARRVGGSYVVKIDFTSLNPEQSIKIANAIVDAYTVGQLSAKDQSNKRTRDWLQERFQTLREQALSADRAVSEFKAKNNIVNAGGTTLTDQQLTELNTQLAAARARTADIQARLNRVLEVIQSDQPNPTQIATVSESLNNAILQKLWAQYLELTNREADFKTRYGANHESVTKIRDQIRDIQTTMRNELRRVAEIYKSDFEIAKNRQDELAKRLGQVISQSQDQAQIILRGLESTATNYHALYNTFLQRYMESVQQQSFPVTEARMLSPATSVYQGRPRPLYVWVIVVVAGGALGLGFGTLRELMDGVFRTSAQVQSVLDVECLASIPLLKNNGVSVTSVHDQPVAGAVVERPICTDSRMIEAIVDAPFSRYAEAFRFVKLAVDLSEIDTKAAKIVGVTSSLPGEGKSTIAVGLAELAAVGGARAILVDCDLRAPSLSRTLTPEASVGLIEVLRGEVSLEMAVWTDPATKMAFLPSVVKEGLKNASDILAANSTKHFFEELRWKYDYVFVDLSPLAPIADVRAASRLVDSYILVIEWGRTKVDLVRYSLDHARSVQENILGAVLNKVDISVIRKYERKDAKYHPYKANASYEYEI